MKIKRNVLLNPGPATTTDTVKMAQVVPDICPREKEFGEVMAFVSEHLKKIAGGDEDYICVLFAGSGTAGMDSVINSVVAPGKKILIISYYHIDQLDHKYIEKQVHCAYPVLVSPVMPC